MGQESDPLAKAEWVSSDPSQGPRGSNLTPRFFLVCTFANVTITSCGIPRHGNNMPSLPVATRVGKVPYFITLGANRPLRTNLPSPSDDFFVCTMGDRELLSAAVSLVILDYEGIIDTNIKYDEINRAESFISNWGVNRVRSKLMLSFAIGGFYLQNKPLIL